MPPATPSCSSTETPPLRELPDYTENDINTVANIARILLPDVSDVFRVIEQRGFDTPKG